MIDDDPHQWLEQVDTDAALAWVRERNREAERALAADQAFRRCRDEVRALLDAKDQIPYVTRRGRHFYNFWRDEQHPRGLWRRTPLETYALAEPPWTTVLDLDALAVEEGENWVWAGVRTLGPDAPKAMVGLSRGGADAAVWREFCLQRMQFVDGGFQLGEAKSELTWLDADTLIVATDTGPGSMTRAGYARTLRRWHRGTALAHSELLLEAEIDDLGVGAGVDHTPGFERTLLHRAIDFYRSQVLLLADGAATVLDKPADASLALWREWQLLELRSDWQQGDRLWPQGSLLAGPAPDRPGHGDTGRGWTALFTPTATCSLAGWSTTRSRVVLTLLDDVASRVQTLRWHAGQWQREDLPAPRPGSLSLAPLHEEQWPEDPWAEKLLINATDFLHPDRLLLADADGGSQQTLKSRTAYFDAQGMQVQQWHARSADGTPVPYFVVLPTGSGAGPRPTLLYGYGGFELNQLPGYSPVRGTQWLARGGVYVQANIRGGGEFGPAWHQAAVGRNKQRSYDDFIAVAADLIERGITTPQQLAIEGGSNGGLLVAAVMLQRPELFRAVVCQVPLLDMKRFHLLLAGASWMAEYGNPDDAGDWAAIQRYSPYQNVPRSGPLPALLLTTSTRDDRVHPGHARKMAARMREFGHRVLYWENIEGGHGGAADNAQRATMLALQYRFLWRELAGS